MDINLFEKDRWMLTWTGQQQMDGWMNRKKIYEKIDGQMNRNNRWMFGCI